MSRSALPQTQDDAGKQARIKLLIIEDDHVHRMIIKKFAAALDFDIAEAATYERAIMLFGQGRFDCITLDLSLQSHNGTEVLRHLADIGCKIPVLIISGAEDAQRAETAFYAETMKFDILHVVKKPLDLKALKEALTKLKSFVELYGECHA